jgi:hypothetical protein
VAALAYMIAVLPSAGQLQSTPQPPGWRRRFMQGCWALSAALGEAKRMCWWRKWLAGRQQQQPLEYLESAAAKGCWSSGELQALLLVSTADYVVVVVVVAVVAAFAESKKEACFALRVDRRAEPRPPPPYCTAHIAFRQSAAGGRPMPRRGAGQDATWQGCGGGRIGGSGGGSGGGGGGSGIGEGHSDFAPTSSSSAGQTLMAGRGGPPASTFGHLPDLLAAAAAGHSCSRAG